MWKILGRAYQLAACAMLAVALFASTGSEANAQSTTESYVIQNSTGINLPGVTLPQGHDEVRAADGTTCRSAVGGNGAYIDAGFIGNPENNNSDSSLAAYTRLVIPLGADRGRIDCRRLYDLEVRRLEIELKLMELGLNRGIAPASETAEVPIDSGSETASTDGNSNTASASQDGDGVKVADASGGDSWADDGWSTDGLSE